MIIFIGCIVSIYMIGFGVNLIKKEIKNFKSIIKKK
jgi:hypothetical protein